MKTTRLTATGILILLMTALIVGPGCSDKGSLGPTSSPITAKLSAPPADPTTFIEDFKSCRNVGSWSFHTTHRPKIERDDGNTGGYLHDDHVVTFAPRPGTEVGVESIFTGDYRAKKITSIGIDLRCLNYQYDITNRHLTLIVMNDNGTPEYPDDDWGAYVTSDQTLPSKYVIMEASSSALLNEPGWKSYDFDINSQTNELPEGWSFFRIYQQGSEMPAGSWTKLMQNVSYVEFYFGDPMLYYIVQSFDLGIDNARISWQ